MTIRSLVFGLEADAIDRTVDLGYPQHLGDQLAQPVMRRKVVSNPTFAAWARRSRFMSPISTTAAPIMRAAPGSGKTDRPAPAT